MASTSAKDFARKYLKDNGYIEPEDRQYEVTDENGKSQGTVSWGAYLAIKGDKLDRYNPKNDEEKNIIEKIKERKEQVERNISTLNQKAEKKRANDVKAWSGVSNIVGVNNASGKKVRTPLTTIKTNNSALQTVNRAYTDEKYAKAHDMVLNRATLKDLTINSLKRGYVQSLYGQECYKEMAGKKNKKSYYEEKLKSKDYSFIPDTWYKKALSGAMELLGQQASQLMDKSTLTAGITAAGAVAAAGQAGPQIALPEEVITVPAAFLAGIKAGSIANNFEIEAGLAYDEMTKNGVSKDTARTLALFVGAGNAVLEGVQVDELFKSYKILNKSSATKSAAKKVLNYIKNRGLNVANETLQETAQEAVTTAGANVASKIDKGKWEYNWEEMGKRIGETAASSAMSFGLLGVGTDAAQAVNNGTKSAKSNLGKQSEKASSKTEKSDGRVMATVKSSGFNSADADTDAFFDDNGILSQNGDKRSIIEEEYDLNNENKGLNNTDVRRNVTEQNNILAEENGKRILNTNTEENVRESNTINTNNTNSGIEALKDLNTSLQQNGATYEQRKSIINTALDVSTTLSGTGKNIGNIITGIAKITNGTSGSIKESTNVSPDFTQLFGTNLRAFTNSSDNTADESFIRAYSSVFAEALERNNSAVYKELSKSGQNVGTMIADYIISGYVPQGTVNISALKSAAGTVNNVIQSAAGKIGRAHMYIYKTTQATGNFNAAEENTYIPQKNAVTDSSAVKNTSEDNNVYSGNYYESSDNANDGDIIQNDEDSRKNTDNLQNTEEMSEAEITAVVNAINETLLPGAKENIIASMEKVSQKGDIYEFAKRLKVKYEKTGTLGALSQYFTDGGERVISVMDDIITNSDNQKSDISQDNGTVKENTKSSYVNKTKENKHTSEQIKIMEEYDKAIDNNLVQFIKYAKQNKNDTKSAYVLSNVSDRLSSDIKEKLGIDTSDFENVIRVNTISHIENRHGAYGKQDKSMQDINDIARINYIIENYDNIEVLDSKSKEHMDKNQRPAPMIRLSKRIDGTFYVVEAVPDTKKHQLPVITAYKNKAAIQKGDVQASARNVQNDSDAAYNKSISQDNGTVKENTKKRGKREQEAFDEGFKQTYEYNDGNISMEKYEQLFEDIKAEALAGASSDDVITNAKRRSYMDAVTQYQIYSSVMEDKLRSVMGDVDKSAKNPSYETDRNDEYKIEAAQIAEEFGKRIVWFDGEIRGALSGDEIYINRANKKPYMQVVGHELTHNMLKDKNVKAEFLKTLQGYINNTPEYRELFSKKKSMYEKRLNSSVDDMYITEEIAADIGGDLFQNEDFIKKITNERPNIARRIWEKLKNLIKRIQGIKTQYKGDSLKYISDIKAVANMYEYYLKNARSIDNAEETRYKIDRRFKDNYDDWVKNGRKNGVKLTVGRTSEALKSIGVKEKNITIDTSKVNKILNNHKNMSDDIIKQLPELLENPVVIMNSLKKDTRVVILGELYDNAGTPVLSVLELMPSSHDTNIMLDEIKIASAYGKDNVQSLINRSDILYVEPDKKRTDNWLVANRLQLPLHITNYGSIKSISYSEGDVNTKNEKNIHDDNRKTSTKFSLSSSIEETKDLIAVHNLSPEKLLKSLKLGGFPMPSIAITRAEDGYDNFGEISLVFEKDTIDPASANNKVYSGDAWTPTFPSVEYKPNKNKVKELRNLYYSLAKEYGYNNVRSLYGFADESNISDKLNRYGGEDAVIENLKDDTELMQLFFLMKGEEKILPVEKEVVTQISKAQKEQFDYLIEKVGKEFFEKSETPPGENPVSFARKYFSQNGEELKQAFKDMFSELYGFSDNEINNIVNNRTDRDYVNLMRDCRRYMKNGGTTVKTETDMSATKEKIRQKAEKLNFGNWVDETFKGISEKKGIPNNKDPYNSSGDRRSWETLHYEFTLENIVSAMKEQGEKGIGGFGGENIFGAVSDEYNSIESIKKDAKKRMKNLSQQEYDDIRQGFSDRLLKLSKAFAKDKNNFNAINDAADTMIEAVSKYKTKQGISNYLKKEGQGWTDYSENIVDDLIVLVKEIGQMPVGYFEAKPQRVVGIDEIKAAVIPKYSESDKKLEEIKTIFNRNNIPVSEYQHGDNEARKKALNSLENVRFSLDNAEENDSFDSEKKYTYEELIKKPDMSITVLDNNIPKDENGKINRKGIIETGIENVREKKNQKNTETDSYIYVKDIDKNILVGKRGLSHGLSRNALANALVTTKIGDILENSIQINDLVPRKNTVGGYVLLGIGADENQNYYPVRVVVNNYSVDNIEVLGVLYAVNAKKKKSQFSKETELPAYAVPPIKGSSTISIAELLNLVKDNFSDVLPKNVLKELNTERTKSNLSESVKYSLNGDTDKKKRQSYIRSLEAENLHLKRTNEILKAELSLTENDSVNMQTIQKATNRLTREYSSKIDKKYLDEQFTKMFKNYKKAAADAKSETEYNEAYADFLAEADNIAYEILQDSETTDRSMFDDNKIMRKDIQGTAIKLSEQDRADMGDYNAFRKNMFGKIKLGDSGMSVDSFYEELCEKYPSFFSKDITHPADRLMRIGEVMDETSIKTVNPYSNDIDEAAAYLAQEIVSDIADAGRVKPTYADKMAKLKREYRAAYDKAVKEVKEKTERILQERKNLEEKQRSARQEREMRESLLKVIKRLQKLRMSPEERAKIPDMVWKIDSEGLGIIKKGYTKTDENGNRIRIPDKVDLTNLKKKVAELERSDPNYIPDKNLIKKISRVDNIQINDMSASDAQDLLEACLQVENDIRTSRKLIESGVKREIYEAARCAESEIRSAKGVNGIRIGQAWDDFKRSQLAPVREARRMVGYVNDSVFVKLVSEINDGQRKCTEFEMNSSKKFDSFAENKEYMKKLAGHDAEFIEIKGINGEDLTDVNGKKVKITHGQLISLYLSSKNYDNLRHIKKGGITVPNTELYKRGKIKEAYAKGSTVRLEPQQIRLICEKNMTEEDMRFANVAHEFFNVDSKNAVNEVSLKLKGYEAARVNNYFPINTNKNFINGNFESLIKDGTLEGSGMLKERVMSGVPIVLEDITSVIDRHIKNVGKYYGLAVPIRNFTSVYNSISTGYGSSLKGVIAQKWGSGAAKYIENFMTDLQGGRDTYSSIFDRARGKYAQAVLSINAAVTIKQAASYVCAASEVGWKPIIQAFSQRVTKQDRAIIDKYTPLLWYRSKGYSLSELGDWTNAKQDWAKKMPALMGWIQKMDIMTTTKLWKAAEFYVSDNNKSLKKGSDEYYKAVAKAYNRIIENTQPNYTTMQRSDILRNPNSLVKSVTTFKTQVQQNAGIWGDSIGEFCAKRAAYKKVKNKSTEAEYKAAVKKLVNSMTSQIVSGVILTVMNFAGKILLANYDRYEDKEKEKMTPQSAAKRMGLDLFESFTGMVIGGSEVTSMVEAMLNIGRWNDMSPGGISLVNDLVSSVVSFSKSVSKIGEGNKNYKDFLKPAAELVSNISQFGGIPVKNAYKLLDGLFKNCVAILEKNNIIENKAEFDYRLMKLYVNIENSENRSDFMNLLMEAYDEAMGKEGDEKKKAITSCKYIYNDMLKCGIPKSKIMDKLSSKRKEILKKDENMKKYVSEGMEDEALYQDIKKSQGNYIDDIYSVIGGIDYETKEKYIKNDIASAENEIKKQNGKGYDMVALLDAYKSGDMKKYNEIKEYMIQEEGDSIKKDIDAAIQALGK